MFVTRIENFEIWKITSIIIYLVYQRIDNNVFLNAYQKIKKKKSAVYQQKMYRLINFTTTSSLIFASLI